MVFCTGRQLNKMKIFAILVYVVVVANSLFYSYERELSLSISIYPIKKI